MKKEIAIVMIDNNSRDHDVFSLALNNLDLDYRCLFIRTVDEAMKLLRKAIPDFIFINIDILNNIECFTRIRKIMRLKNVRLVAYSETFDNIAHEKILKKGADICLTKTAETVELIAGLRKIFIDLSFENKTA